MLHNMLATLGYPTDHGMSARPRQAVFKASARQKQRPAQSQPVDPQELARKLYVVLAEQKAHSERKRRAKAEAERFGKKAADKSRRNKKSKEEARSATASEKSPVAPSQPPEAKKSQPEESPLSKDKLRRTSSKKSLRSSKKSTEEEHDPAQSYHHVPQVAAAQFARTTTVESLSEKSAIHKLSIRAMKFHLEGPNASAEMAAAGPGASPCEQAKALRRAQSTRERQYERNQIRLASNLPVTVEDVVGHPRLSQRHTFQAHLRMRGGECDDAKDIRRMSTGSILGTTEAPAVPVIGSFDGSRGVLLPSAMPEFTCAPDEHRVDWTQADEELAAKESAAKALAAKESEANELPTLQTSQSPLRKVESKWKLRGRLGSFTRHGKDDKPPSPTDEMAHEDSILRSPKSGFFARFKR